MSIVHVPAVLGAAVGAVEGGLVGNGEGATDMVGDSVGGEDVGDAGCPGGKGDCVGDPDVGESVGERDGDIEDAAVPTNVKAPFQG